MSTRREFNRDLLTVVVSYSLLRTAFQARAFAGEIDPVLREGLPERRGFGSKIFAYKKGTATAPHAHNNLVSAHLVLKGTFHVRTYERMDDEADHLIISPSIDEQSNAGRTISMSDERDNVHWFLATSDHAYTFDVPVTNVYPGKRYDTEANRYGMIYVDPAGERLAEDRIRARIIPFEEALARYGRSHVG